MLGLDFRFLSEEYPEFVGSAYNDAFIAELDKSTWTTQGSTITAPDNFAFDPTGNPISVNAAGATSMTPAESAGTTYDGATPLLSAATPIAPGTHSLYVSIFDQADNARRHVEVDLQDRHVEVAVAAHVGAVVVCPGGPTAVRLTRQVGIPCGEEGVRRSIRREAGQRRADNGIWSTTGWHGDEGRASDNRRVSGQGLGQLQGGRCRVDADCRLSEDRRRLLDAQNDRQQRRVCKPAQKSRCRASS
ncbi:MAG: choice-of-anchor L domain-containing protein, partial [Candidatus Dormiibacterota bacterium]